MVRVKKSAAHTSTHSLTPSAVQLFFIIAAALALLSQIGQTLYSVSQQLPENMNLSAYLGWFTGLCITLLLIGGLFLTRRRRDVTRQSVFEVALVTTAVSVLAMTLSWLTWSVGLPLHISDGNFVWYIAISQLVPYLLILPFLVVFIRRLRARGQW